MVVRKLKAHLLISAVAVIAVGCSQRQSATPRNDQYEVLSCPFLQPQYGQLPAGDAPVGTAALSRELKDPSWFRRFGAVLIASRLARSAPAVHPDLLEAISDPNAAVQEAAFKAVPRTGVDSDQTAERLMSFVESGTQRERSLASTALSESDQFNESRAERTIESAPLSDPDCADAVTLKAVPTKFYAGSSEALRIVFNHPCKQIPLDVATKIAAVKDHQLDQRLLKLFHQSKPPASTFIAAALVERGAGGKDLFLVLANAIEQSSSTGRLPAEGEIAQNALFSVNDNREGLYDVMVQSLSSENPNLRDLAVFKIGDVHPDAGEAARTIIPLIEDGNNRVQGEAIASLRRIGPAAINVLPALFDSASREHGSDWMRSAELADTITAIDPDLKNSLPLIAQSLSATEGKKFKPLIDTLARLPLPCEAVPLFSKYLASSVAEIHKSAVYLVIKTPEDCPARNSILSKQPRYKVNVKKTASRGAYRELSEKQRRIGFRAALQQLKNPDQKVREEAMSDIKYGPIHPSFDHWNLSPTEAEAILEAADSEYSDVRVFFLEELTNFFYSTESKKYRARAAAELLAALKDPESNVRCAAAGGLLRVGEIPPDAVDPILTAFETAASSGAKCNSTNLLAATYGINMDQTEADGLKRVINRVRPLNERLILALLDRRSAGSEDSSSVDIGPNFDEAAEIAVRVLCSPDPELRAGAARVLGATEITSSGVQAALLWAENDKNRDVANEAVSALRRLGLRECPCEDEKKPNSLLSDSALSPTDEDLKILAAVIERYTQEDGRSVLPDVRRRSRKHSEFSDMTGSLYETGFRVPLPMMESLVARNSGEQEISRIAEIVSEVHLIDSPEAAEAGRGWLIIGLPGYSEDKESAIVEFTFGPTTHGAAGIAYLVKKHGSWAVELFYAGYFA